MLEDKILFQGPGYTIARAFKAETLVPAERPNGDINFVSAEVAQMLGDGGGRGFSERATATVPNSIKDVAIHIDSCRQFATVELSLTTDLRAFTNPRSLAMKRASIGVMSFAGSIALTPVSRVSAWP